MTSKFVSYVLLAMLASIAIVLAFDYRRTQSDAVEIRRAASEAVQELAEDTSRADRRAAPEISSVDLAKLGHLAELEYVYSLVSGRSESAAEYWRPAGALRESMLEQEIVAGDAIRQSLRERFGDAAVDDPIFRKYFYPLGAAFRFLSSEKQVEISQLRIRSNLSLQNTGVGARQLSAVGAARSSYFRAVEGILTEEEYFEFQLRESGLAQEARNSGLDWTENEFRQVVGHRLRVENDSTAWDSPTSLFVGVGHAEAYDPEIQRILGWDRYLEYLKSVDPKYRTMRNAAARMGRSSRDLENAYGEYVGASHDIVQMQRSGDPAGAQRRKDARDAWMRDHWGGSAPAGIHSRFPSELVDLLQSK